MARVLFGHRLLALRASAAFLLWTAAAATNHSLAPGLEDGKTLTEQAVVGRNASINDGLVLTPQAPTNLEKGEIALEQTAIIGPNVSLSDAAYLTPLDHLRRPVAGKSLWLALGLMLLLFASVNRPGLYKLLPIRVRLLCTSCCPSESDQEQVPLLREETKFVSLPDDRWMLHLGVEKMAAERPDNAALVVLSKEQTRTITFADLNGLANHIAMQLLQKHVPPSQGTVIGVGAEKEEMVAAILGAWKTGNPYTPLPPILPAERMSFILHDAEVPVVLVDDLSYARCAEVCQDQVAMLPISFSDWIGTECALPRCVPSDLCYVLYTSGSTGKPKGVRATHRSMYNRFLWMWETFPFSSDEACLAWTSPAFVDHVWEIFGGIGAGVPLVWGMQLSLKAKPHEALHVIHDHSITRLVMVPSVLRELLNAAESSGSVHTLSSARYLTVSGEALPCELIGRCIQALPDSSTLLNIYGCTEVAADATYAVFQQGMVLPEGPLAPIGKPITGVQAMLLDPDSLLPTKFGEAGELFLAGECLAEGYLNRQAEEAERFVVLGGRTRAFRTGDFCRQASDGSLYFIGRQDQQVKINGQRVELLEVEAALQAALRSSGKSTGVVVAVEGIHGYSLVAFVVPQLEQEVVRSAMEQLLPSAWVPCQFHALGMFPLLPTGKVNRKELCEIAKTHQQHAMVVDSLGVARQASQEISFAMSVVQCCYFVAIVHIIMSHWYDIFCQTKGASLCGSWHNVVTESNLWMVVFYFGFGIGERLRSSSPRLGKQEAFLALLYYTWDVILQPILSSIAEIFGAQAGLGDKWFIFWMLATKLILVASYRIMSYFGYWYTQERKSEHLVCLPQVGAWLGLTWVASCFFTATGYGFWDAKLFISPSWGHAWLINPLLEPIQGFGFISLASYCMSVAACVLGFGLGTKLCSALDNAMKSLQSSQSRTMVRLIATAILALSIAFADMHDGAGRWHDSLKFPFGMPIAFVATMLQLCCLILVLSSLPEPMLFLGRFSLMAYISHHQLAAVFCEQGLLIPGCEDTALHLANYGGNLLAAVSLYVYPLIFLVLFCWPISQFLGLVAVGSHKVLSGLTVKLGSSKAVLSNSDLRVVV
eukprot:TRINITY_DN23354_c0_g1_i1.p1 TRINITY_DN23354_c0_g1~~TRINITY_DN23354_c0_g1_i1.p1  ORF type:complete len:1124 (-),score=172.77 TRINITY_DN23354_c0_g1_i1:62-3379(-)